MHINVTSLFVAALALVIASVAPPATRAQAQASLTVVTYNIRYDNPNDGVNVWTNRRDAMVAYLQASRADIIGLQEVEPQQRAFLAEKLTGFEWYGVGRNAEHDQGEGTPIFFRRDRFERLDQGTFWLSATPSVPGSRGWDAQLPRVASWLTLRDRNTKVEMLVVNTHFDHRGPEARKESAALLVKEIDRLAGAGRVRMPVVLTGDFNCRSTEPPYAEIVKPANSAMALIDAIAVSRTPASGGDSTSNAFTAIAPGAKIDYVFVRDVPRVLAHRIEDPRIEGRFVSDHQPIVVELQLQP